MSRESKRTRPSKAERRAAERRRAQRRMLAFALGGAALVGIAVAVVVAGRDASGPGPSAAGAVEIGRASGAQLTAGELVPSFSAPALGGGRFEWSSYVGRPTVLAVWAPWCPHCQKELPSLSAAVAAHPGLQLVSVATAIGQEPGPSVQGYMAGEGLTFPVAIDDGADTIGQGLGVTGFPLVYYVGSDGRVMDVTVGEVPPGQLESLLTRLEGGP
ncbi:MAG: TlpA family protein disulfide reductase [Actinobacteria bacterium]|nr:TlpA family protein disulfide reductase [Actinomycetota bacterium]